MKEKGYPVEKVALDSEYDHINGFYWEPHGPRFCISHVNTYGKQCSQPYLTLFEILVTEGTASIVKSLGTLKNKKFNEVCWSTKGKKLLLAGLRHLGGLLEFFSVDDFSTLSIGEQFNCTGVAWDPTGRYVAAITDNTSDIEQGFSIWSYNGKLLYKMLKDGLESFEWRPRPPSILTSKQKYNINKQLKLHKKYYDKEDDALLKIVDFEALLKKDRLHRWFHIWIRPHKLLVGSIRHKAKKKYPWLFYDVSRIFPD